MLESSKAEEEEGDKEEERVDVDLPPPAAPAAAAPAPAAMVRAVIEAFFRDDDRGGGTSPSGALGKRDRGRDWPRP